MLPPPPTSPLFPYTTLFRSLGHFEGVDAEAPHHRFVHRLQDLERLERSGLAHLRLAEDEARTRHGDLVERQARFAKRSEEHTSELQSQSNLVCRLLLEKKKN